YFGKSIFRPKKGMFKIDFRLIKNIFIIGFPSFLTAITDSIIFLIFNRAILYYGNDAYLAIAGITIRIMDLIVMPIIGITHGFSTIASFNYGAKLYTRVKKILREAVLWTGLIAITGFIATMFFPHFLLRIFTDNTQIINDGIVPMRIIVTFLPLIGFLIVGGSLFQAIGKPVPALIINFSRQVIFLLPAILILPIFCGLNGVFMSWPVSDFLSFIVTIIFVSIEIRIINKSINQIAEKP
ncbi:MAG TPA: MATE family efflux transporter, partial [Actinobacteria bacterium]|nr:MATE family efflux transporter [Actinomycetota bacterium]